MGTPGGLQGLVLIVCGAVVFAAEEAVLESMLVCNVRASVGFELGEFVGAVRVGAE